MTLIFFKVVLMQLKHIVAQCNVEQLEQYVLNKLHFTLTELLENFLNSRLAIAYIFSFAFFRQIMLCSNNYSYIRMRYLKNIPISQNLFLNCFKYLQKYFLPEYKIDSNRKDTIFYLYATWHASFLLAFAVSCTFKASILGRSVKSRTLLKKLFLLLYNSFCIVIVNIHIFEN